MLRRVLVPVLLALAMTTVAVPGQLAPSTTSPTTDAPTPDIGNRSPPAASTDGEGRGGGEGAGALRLDDARWHTTDLAAPVTFTEQDHQAIVDAAEQGMAYDVANDEPVPLPKGEVVIQPGRMLIARNKTTTPWETCSIGFVQGSPGSYEFVTAAHCVNTAEEVVVPTRYNPTHFIAAGEVVEEEQVDGARSLNHAVDWAVIRVLDAWQESGDATVNPTVFGGAGPFSTNWDPIEQESPTDYAGTLTPWPVYYVGQPRPVLSKAKEVMEQEAPPSVPALFTVDTPAPGAGVLVERVGKSLLCECPFVPGDSGGPVLGPSGEAIGIVAEWATRARHNVSQPPRGALLADPSGELDYRLSRMKGQHEVGRITPVSEIPGSVTTVQRSEQAAYGAAGCNPWIADPCRAPSPPCDPLLDVECLLDHGPPLEHPGSEAPIPVSAPEVPNTTVPSPGDLG